nr:putative regulatory protein [Amycolatopsis sp.]
MLALLLMYANTIVSIDEFIEELWENRPPRSAVQTVQTYVMQLRKMLGAGPRGARLAERLVTTHSGYSFRVAPDELDVTHFDRLVSAAHAAVARQEHAVAASRFAEALTLWRGPALANVRIGPISRIRLVGLLESKLTAVEQRIEADLRLGRHHRLLSELSMLIERYPMYENLYAQFMLALYRSGRQIQALEVFQRLRRELSGEQGLEPSPRMQRLHQAVLTGNPLLDLPAPPDTGLSLHLVS